MKISKEEKVFNIALSVFELEEEKGHLNWKITELVEKTEVSRSLIYRYFGGNKEEILLEAVKAFVSKFYGLGPEASGDSFLQKVQNARKLMEEYPQAAVFYLRWRDSDTFIKDELIKTENDYQKMLGESFPHLGPIQIKALHSLLHGFVTAPFVNHKDIPKMIEGLPSLFEKNLIIE